MKRFLSYILVLFILTALVGCAGNNSEETATKDATTSVKTTTENATTIEGEKKVKVFTCWNPSETPSGNTTSKFSETRVGKALSKITGYSVDTNYILGDAEQAFTLKLAGNDWEDIISMGQNTDWINKLLEVDAIIPLDKYFDDPVNYPNLAKIDKRIIDYFRHTDGHIYHFPSGWYENLDSAQYGYWCAHGWYINKPIMDEVGFKEEDLATIEGVEKYLRAVKEKGLKNSAGKPVLPLTGGENFSLRDTVATTFGVTSYGYDEYNGEIMNFRDVPAYKDAMKWINKMWREGLIDKEMFSQKNEQLKEKLSNERCALIVDQAWSFWDLMTSGEKQYTIDTKPIHFPKISGVSKLGKSTQYNPFGWGGFVVTKACKSPDDVAKYADWCLTTGEQREWELDMGPRGDLWDWDKEKGEPYFRISDEIADYYSKGDVNKAWEVGYRAAYGGHSYISPFDLDGGYYSCWDTPNPIQWVIDMHLFNVKEGYTTMISDYNMVKLPQDGKSTQFNTVLDSIDKQYLAKACSANTEAEFEAGWEEWRNQLEQQGHFSEVKEEFIKTYKEQFSK